MIKKIMSKFFKVVDEVYNQAWTIAGTVLVLITLSGDVQSWGIKISLATLGIHLLGVIIRPENKEQE